MSSRIVELNIEAVKRITAAHINPDGSMVILGGKNAQGKTSVLDAIAYALGGAKLIPSEPLQRGADKGHVTVTLDDGVTIKRTFTKKGGTLKITTADGMSPSSAQGWLNARLGALSFDPTAFMRDKPDQQATTLRELCGVDTTEIDAGRKAAYQQRTEIGRDGKTAKGAAESAQSFDDAPDVAVSVSDLMERRRDGQGQHHAHSVLVRDVESLRRDAASQEDDAARLDAESDADLKRAEVVHKEALRRADEALLAAKGKAKAGESRASDMRKNANHLKAKSDDKEIEATKHADTLPDLDTIDAEIAGADDINAKVRANARKAELDARVTDLRGQYDAKSTEIAALDKKRADMLAKAEMPVEGLGINDDGLVTFNEIPIDQASEAERIRVSIGIGLALSPELRIILIRDGSLLDADNLSLIAKLAEEADAQVWIERVGDADEGAIVIEDGQVRGSAD
jgi:DNA repair exonuclease SbcCD ATPase subunit